MNEEAKKLFLANYHNEGDCQGLLEKAKTLKKENRKTGVVKTIYYLPWALVERIFRLQGGSVEVKEWIFPAAVSTAKTQVPDDLTGELTTKEVEVKAIFLHLSATWMGETLEEHYPIFDNQTSKVITAPDAQDLNAAKQRGMVRLIARISGIGLSIFEQDDSQFESEEEGKPAVPKAPSLSPAPKAKPAEAPKTPAFDKLLGAAVGKEPASVAPAPAPKAAVGSAKPAPAKAAPDDSNAFLDMMMSGGKPTAEAVEPAFPQIEEEDYGKETEQYVEKMLAVKKIVRANQAATLAYMKSKGAATLSQLTYKQLAELESILPPPAQ